MVTLLDQNNLMLLLRLLVEAWLILKQWDTYRQGAVLQLWLLERHDISFTYICIKMDFKSDVDTEAKYFIVFDLKKIIFLMAMKLKDVYRYFNLSSVNFFVARLE